MEFEEFNHKIVKIKKMKLPGESAQFKMAPKERIKLMQLTGEIVKQRQISVLFTEHDMDVVFAHAHKIMVLNRGQLIASGSVEQIRNDAKVQEVYLGGGSLYAIEEQTHA